MRCTSSPGRRPLNARLRKWEQVYNHIRPHQALHYLTPAQALEKFKKKAPVSHLS